MSPRMTSSIGTRWKKYPKLGRESGVMLIFFAILLPVLLLVLGLAIDLGLASSAHQQLRNQTRLLALAAVETYFDPGTSAGNLQSLSPQERLDAALLRVNQLAAQNPILSTGGNLPTFSLGASARNTSTNHLLPGRYYFTNIRPEQCRQGFPCLCGENELASQCNPCPDGGALPCFVSISPEDVTGDNPEPISAFQLEANLGEGIISRFLTPLLGHRILPSSATNLATAVPRKVLFLVDISDSAVRETYPKRPLFRQEQDPLHGRGSQYAFYIDPNRDCSPQNCSACPTDLNESSDYSQWQFLACYSNSAGYGGPGLSREDTYTTDFNLDDISDPFAPSIPVLIEGFAENPLVHFYSDYETVTPIRFPEDLSGHNLASSVDLNAHPNPEGCQDESPNNDRYCPTAFQETFRVDTYCDRLNQLDRPEWCQGPQPLGYILSGLIDAVRSFRARLVAGDQMGVIFFDRTISWTRVIKLTDNFQYIEDAISNLDMRLALGMFPGRESYTDLKLAIAEAYSQLALARSESAGTPSRDSIVLISDGLTNCGRCAALGDQPGDIDGNGIVNFSDMTSVLECFGATCACPDGCYVFADITNVLEGMACGTYGCRNDYAHYKEGMTTTKENVRASDSQNIPIHILAVGRNIGPHLVDVQDPRVPGETLSCLTDRQARANNLSVVSQLDDAGHDPCEDDDECALAFNQASEETPFYKAASDLYDIARASGGVYAPLFFEMADHCGSSPDRCHTSPNHEDCCQPGRRWTTDKLCRNPEAQVSEFVDAIMSGEAPYIIVDGS